MTPASSAAAALQGHRPVESEATRRQRRHLAMAYRVLHRAGIDDLTYNHLSARLPDRPDRFLVKRADELFEQVTASSLLVSDFAGADPDPAGRVSPGGLVIHGGVLEARPDVAAMFHTHSPAAMAVSVQKCGLLPLTQHALIFHGRVAYHDFHGFEFEPRMRELLVRDLGTTADIMILRNHGVLVTGRTVPEAVFRHHYLEMACRAQVAALGASRPEDLILPDEATCRFGAEQMASRGVVDERGRDWTALTRLADAVFPDYAD